MPCFEGQKGLNGFLPKPKPKIETCGDCGAFDQFNRDNKCRKGISTKAHATTKACSQAISKDDQRRAF